MKIKLTIFTNWSEVEEQIKDYCTEPCYVEYFQGDIPEQLDNDENLILEGEGPLMVPSISKIIDINKLNITRQPNDFESDLMIKFCVIYPQDKDLLD